jgi:hypothetical protein
MSTGNDLVWEWRAYVFALARPADELLAEVDAHEHLRRNELDDLC